CATAALDKAAAHPARILFLIDIKISPAHVRGRRVIFDARQSPRGVLIKHRRTTTSSHKRRTTRPFAHIIAIEWGVFASPFAMRLRHIEIFEAIRRTGSLTEAAAALHISQPAASKLLAHAEMQLGFKLFERVKGRLVATREAEILSPEVTRLNQDLNSVRRLA